MKHRNTHTHTHVMHVPIKHETTQQNVDIMEIYTYIIYEKNTPSWHMTIPSEWTRLLRINDHLHPTSKWHISIYFQYPRVIRPSFLQCLTWRLSLARCNQERMMEASDQVKDFGTWTTKTIVPNQQVFHGTQKMAGTIHLDKMIFFC